MPFTVRDFESLLRALDKRAEWRAQLRRLLLTDDLLSLPEIVRRLAGHLEQLAAAQQRTEGRLEQLAAAQQRTEGRLEQLAAAQQRTESRLEQLAAAQRRTEDQVARLVEEMRRLAEGQREMARQVGALAETIGFTLEDLAREVAPAYLEKHYGIRVAKLQRRFLTLDTEEVEVDLYGEGTRDGERIVVVGEVKSRIYGRDVEALGRRIQALAAALPGIPVPVLFGFVVHPSAIDAAARAGAVVITSAGARG
ncbi:MAG: hypothetical protein QN201_03230 [Armatimonadota bacterium]|nr:hypothetical protein [Armatimonadota bacterium]